MSSTDNDSSQYLTFILNDEEYGVNILKVQELRGWSPVTRMPNLSSHILGVLNLRGEVIPIMDLRRRFGMDAIKCTPMTVIIIVRGELTGSDETIPVGLVVDAVSETHTIRHEEIQPPPKIMGDSIQTEHVTGLFPFEEKMLILLDINELIQKDVLSGMLES